jgi:hypothetical protein
VTCNEIAEFLSALCDGEMIPPDAAQHIGACEACKLLLRDYAEMGAELRRIASLEAAEPAPSLKMEPKPRRIRTLLQKGRESMKIPKFAFALLILAVIALASSLAVIGVGAHSSGNVLMLRAALPGRDPYTCFIDTTQKGPNGCTIIGVMNGSMGGFQFQTLARNGDRVQLGFRSKATPFAANHQGGMGFADVASQPQAQYWFEPGQTLKIDMQGVGTLAVTGEWTDHMPVMLAHPSEALDPNAGELRLLAPVLVRDKQVIADVLGTAEATHPGEALLFDTPPLGRYLLSQEPMNGAVEANVWLNRITFELNGQVNVIVSGAPVTRAHSVWVLCEPDFKPPFARKHGYVISAKLSMIAPEAVLPAQPSVK